MDSFIRPVSEEDADQIIEIYNYYVLNTEISFEETKVSRDEMINRINEKTRRYPWLVYEENGKIKGYTYAGKWKERSAYRHTAEDTVYVRDSEKGRGIGTKLFTALMERLENDPEVHVIIAVIALPNEGSVALHRQFGFHKAARFTEVGFKNGKWIDVEYWEKVVRH